MHRGYMTKRSARFRDHACIDFFELVEDPLDYVLLIAEQFVRPARMNFAERRIVEGRCFHDPSGGQLGDYQFDEADLRRAQAVIVEELREGRLRGGAVEADQGADEVRQRGCLAPRQQP